MASDFETVLREQARELIDPDEEILASVVAQPRGTGVARSGANLGAQAIGSAWARRSRSSAESAGLDLTTPMALALTQRRLIVFGLETSALGKPKAVKELHSSEPLEAVESISVKRLLVGKTMKITMRSGGEVKLEIGAGQDAKGLAEQFERAKASA
jgi:hypothetical protein